MTRLATPSARNLAVFVSLVGLVGCGLTNKDGGDGGGQSLPCVSDDDCAEGNCDPDLGECVRE